MRHFFLFRLPISESDKYRRSLAIYCSVGFDYQAFENPFREHIEIEGRSDYIYLLGAKKDFDNLKKIEKIIDERESFGPFKAKVELILFDISNISNRVHFDGSEKYGSNAELNSNLFRFEGMWSILERHKGLLKSTSTHHYALPSGKHSNQYIRVANAMIDYAEIEFIALFCLKDVDSITELKYIYCDTGGIIPVAGAVCHLVSYLSGSPKCITYESFSSYDVLRADKKYRFGSAENSLFLISASAFGGLVDDLRRRYQSLQSAKMIYLYSFRRLEGRTVLCEIEEKSKDKITAMAEGNCDLCRSGSIPLRIKGDHLQPEDNQDTESITIRQADAPKWLDEFMMFLKEKKLVSVNHRRSSIHTQLTQTSAHEIFIDLQNVFEELGKKNKLDAEWSNFKCRLGQLLNNAVSCKVKRIIHLDNPGSKIFAEYIKSDMELSGDVKIIPFNLKDNAKYFSQKFAQENCKDNTLVVASVVSSGRELLGLSQVLRNLQCNHGITYIVGLDRLSSSSIRREFQSNLTFGEQPNDFGLFVVKSIELPHSNESSVTVWDQERQFLNDNLLPMIETLTDSQGGEAIKGIKERIDILQNSHNSGLINDLYWKSSQGNVLKLRPDTAFLKKKNYQDDWFSQADVYLLVTALLHQLRHGENGNHSKRSLQQHAHQNKILSPVNFDRFNDGVLQASLLRAANAAELDYKEKKFSMMMRELILYLTQQESLAQNGGPGEALREFILCIAMGKMQLALEDIKSINDAVTQASKAQQDPILWAFSHYIGDKILNDTGRLTA